MIDLHTHTRESDGTCSPQELVEAARRAGLEALGITDHDTFAGYEQAVPLAREAGLPLICGIELSTAWGSPKEKSVHLLGYFIDAPPPPALLDRLGQILTSRRDRNRRLALKLQSLGCDIRIEEVEAMGRSLAGRPHFARLLVAKGYCKDISQAFREYLDESAPAYVQRDEPAFEEAVALTNQNGGISSLAHPVRLGKRNLEEEEKLVRRMAGMGLRAIEVWHSDHSPADEQRFLAYARKYGLKVTGGSDFHGGAKPGVRLGVGAGKLRIPRDVLEQLRA
ncbi:MAG: PHP domain-containing protein [Acidobacteria bacterium]|nr:PHP domain-containing protein [Acidobacteriota bacterium]